MKEYRRLTDREKRKVKMYKSARRKTVCIIKRACVIMSVFALFAIAAAAFYKVVDSRHSEESGIGGDNLKRASENIDSQKDKDIDVGEDGMLEGERKFSGNEEDSENEEKEGAKRKEKKYISVNFSEWNKTCKREFMVVNKFSKPYDGSPVKTKLCRGKEVGIELCESLEKMILDARGDGIILWISSGYRSVNHQTKLFNRQIEREKSKGLSEDKAIEAAESVVARPGTSEHNLGLAVDFNGVEDDFYKTKEYKWLTENAHKYGFIERYKKEWQNITGVISEPWHFRYVGEDQAGKIKESGMCLEEYVSRVLMGRNGTGGIF